MAKESPYGIDKRLIFRETFSSEAEVRRNGGTPVGVTFDKGVAVFSGAAGTYVSYTIPVSGIFSICNQFRIQHIQRHGCSQKPSTG